MHINSINDIDQTRYDTVKESRMGGGVGGSASATASAAPVEFVCRDEGEKLKNGTTAPEVQSRFT